MEVVNFLMQAVSLLALLSGSEVNGQYSDCSMLQASELGDNTTLSSTGLLAEALNAVSQATLTYQLLEFNTVCLAQGTARDTYRSTSLVVMYRPSVGDVSTMQLHLQCINGDWSDLNFGSADNAISTADGSLITPTRRDCLVCVSPATPIPVSTQEHCSGKSIEVCLASQARSLTSKGGLVSVPYAKGNAILTYFLPILGNGVNRNIPAGQGSGV